MTGPYRRMIHYTELPPAQPGSPLEEEDRTYRREVARLLAEGHEGKYVLIKGDAVVGLWDTFAEAYAEGLKRFSLQPMLVHQVQTWERLVRNPLDKWLCRHSRSRSGRTA